MNVGDQVDVGTLDHYEHIHLFKSELMSPYLPIMTTIGNHETYQDPDMKNVRTMTTQTSNIGELQAEQEQALQNLLSGDIPKAYPAK